MSATFTKQVLESVIITKEYKILLDWVNSISLPSCVQVINSDILRQGIALNDISSLILNIELPQNVYRDPDSEFKVQQNLKILLRTLNPLLPNHLSKLTAKDMMNSTDKLFLILRWMAKILDFPFYQKLKSSFGKFYSKGVEMPEENLNEIRLAKAKSLGKMLKETEKRMKSPEQAKYKSPWTVNQVDLYQLMKEMHVFKGKTQEEFLSLCRTGELIADLINVIEGKQIKLQGITKRPLWKTYKAANISRILKYLRDFPKMKSTYLWSDSEIMEGKIKTIKGLIYDILVLYNKVPIKKLKSSPKSVQIVRPSLQTNPVLFSTQTSPTRPMTRLSAPRQYTEVFSYEKPEKSIELSEDCKVRISEWLVSLDLGHLVLNASKDFFSDNLRNGIVLCELAGLITCTKSLAKYKNPKSISEACENIETAFKVLKECDKDIPLWFITNPMKIVRGENEPIWGLLCHIMLAFPQLLHRIPKYNLKELPYNPEEIKDLQQSLLEFILSQGCIERRKVSLSFQELLPDIVSGVLLSDLVSKVIQKPIFGIFRSQISESLAMSNIKKSLEPLRTLRKMGQQYVFAEPEIIKGNLGVILGLLEDLHRYADKIPPRQRGENYHKDGPYLGKPIQKKYLPHRLSFSVFSEYENSGPITAFSKTLTQSQSTGLKKFNSAPSSPIQDYSEKLGEFSWLKHLNINLPQRLDMRNEEIPEFSSGVLLSEILSKLERKKISGICEKPNSQAASLHNLEKALEVLVTKSSFPSYLCYCEEDIFRGDGDVIRAILREVYKIFRVTIGSMKSFNLKKLALG